MAITRFVFTILLTTVSSYSYSEQQLLQKLTVKRVFSENGDVAGFVPAESLAACKYGLMYIDLSNESGRAIFSMVLSAKSTDQKVVRIDYNVTAEEACVATGLHIE
ncbi:hypothetical protein [Microbulbifer agarilyticus]